MAHYFTADTDKAIALYKSLESNTEKNLVFDREIRPAFEKLIESLIFVNRFFKIDDIGSLKGECFAVLYDAIPKFDPNRGFKGFSYFNVVAKNYFIQRIRDNKRKATTESDLFCGLDHEAIKSDPSLIVSSHEKQLEDREWWLKFYEQMESWRNKPLKKQEKQVLEAVIFLMKNSELVSIYNKKAVYLYLRDMTGLSTKQVVANLKRIKDLYDEWYEEFNSNGESEACLTRSA